MAAHLPHTLFDGKAGLTARRAEPKQAAGGKAASN